MTTTTTPTLPLIELWQDATIEACVAGVADGSTALAVLTDIRSRDVLIWLATTGSDRFTLDDLRELGQSAFTFAVRGRGALGAAPAMAAVAYAAWMDGSVPVEDAASLVRSALLFEPGYRFAELLQAALDSGMPASAFAEAIGSLTYDQTRYGLA